jgi:glycosyltransferase involved in cell wall biosynthesis
LVDLKHEVIVRVCYFGTYRANYSRNKIMIAALRSAGVEVIECHQPLWHGIEDRVQAVQGKWLSLSFWLRVLRTYGRLLIHYRKLGSSDVLMVGYPGQIDVFLARILAWFRGIPLVWDVFMSTYLIAAERGLDERSPFTVKLLGWVEGAALHLPDLLIQDTAQYVDWFHKTYRIPAGRFQLIPTGADNRVFHPVETKISEKDAGAFDVIYYGTFIPNHGILSIIEAARLLRRENAFRFHLIGDGPDREKAQRLAKKYELDNVTFLAWLEQSELVNQVAKADVCLGAFGSTPQSMMTVQNKVYEGLAMRKPIVTGDSPAVQENFTHGTHVYLVARENPQAIAEALRTLKNNPALCKAMSQAGYQLFQSKFNLEAIGKKARSHLESVMYSKASDR